MYKGKDSPKRLQPAVANKWPARRGDIGEGGAGRVAWMRMMGVGSVGYHEHSVAGRGDDPVAGAHEIADAERDATMAYLDAVVRDRGGRRGRAQVRTPTSGLTWAVSRHALREPPTLTAPASLADEAGLPNERPVANTSTFV